MLLPSKAARPDILAAFAAPRAPKRAPVMTLLAAPLAATPATPRTAVPIATAATGNGIMYSPMRYVLLLGNQQLHQSTKRYVVQYSFYQR